MEDLIYEIKEIENNFSDETEKVKIFIIQLIGWFEFGIRPDLSQLILLLIEREYTSQCILRHFEN